MNQAQPYMDVHSSHLSSAQPYTPHGASAGSIPHYQQYQQPPVLQPGSTSYAPSPSSYAPYGYSNGVTSPQSASQPVTNALTTQMPAQILPLPAMTTATTSNQGYVSGLGSHGQQYVPHTPDTTGQVAPPGMKPRVTATLWEDEGSLCYQVEAKGVCVARREDNHMINGTKLLNVAGMTRGRRDGILKSEKVRHVVKIGPMHLKGVWIPFERALDFANKEKITEQLYPLFVHNIGSLLYHPANQNRTNAIVAASERRRLEGAQASRALQGPQPPPLHHHHSMTALSQPPAHSIAPHPGAGRPGIDRAHTFPTPPTSASSIMGVANQGSSYEWTGQSMGSNVQGSQPLSIDTGLSNPRSMPTTPATTPPGTNLQGMQQYQGQPNYDAKAYYSAAPSSQPHYASHQTMTQQNMARYGQPMTTHPYMNNKMGSSGPTGGPADSDPAETKADPYSHSQGNGQVGHGTSEVKSDHEHHNEYLNDTGAAYSTNRGSYAYTTNPTTATLGGEHSHLSAEIPDSTSHQSGSDRVKSQWTQDYSAPPRPATSSNLYNVMSDTTRTNGTNANAGDSYSTPSNTASAYSSINGSSKRLREEDDQDQTSRPESRGGDGSFDHKRRKTLGEPTVGGPVGGGPLALQGVKPGAVSRRR